MSEHTDINGRLSNMFAKWQTMSEHTDKFEIISQHAYKVAGCVKTCWQSGKICQNMLAKCKCVSVTVSLKCKLHQFKHNGKWLTFIATKWQTVSRHVDKMANFVRTQLQSGWQSANVSVPQCCQSGKLHQFKHNDKWLTVIATK